jgi:hypothetical protein
VGYLMTADLYITRSERRPASYCIVTKTEMDDGMVTMLCSW